MPERTQVIREAAPAGSADQVESTVGPTQDAAFYRQLVEGSSDAIITKDPEAVITSWNSGATELYGYSAEEAIGRPISILVPSDRQGEEFRFLRAVMNGRPIEHYETERITKAGQRVSVSLSLSPIRDLDGEIVAVAAIARDVTERKRDDRRMRYLAHHDPVTGLFNRARFEEELETRLHQAKRYRRPGAVLALDLDDFKLVNDTWGHAAGDALLQRVATALREHTREIDAVGRMGGDEFSVVMSEISSEQAKLVAAKLLRHVSTRWEGRPITASIGVVPFDGADELTAPDLMIAADTALYAAKEQGRNCVAQYSGSQMSSLNLVKRIRRTLDEGRLVLETQPVIDLSSGEVRYEELLVRMLGQDGELIAPGRFLPTAERFRFIQEIDGWVADRALELVAEGRSVAVNLSGLSIADHRLMSGLADRLRGSGLDGSRLTFEITETSALSSVEIAARLIRPLSELGCSFALDDFGAGYVHFGYLKYLPLNYVKIDAEFVRDLGTAHSDLHVVVAIVALTRGFGQKTIAEGVENPETLAALRRLGVDLAQGFHLGRPRPLDGWRSVKPS